MNASDKDHIVSLYYPSDDMKKTAEREVNKGALDAGPFDDRDWFTAHSDRNYRVRAPIEGERIYFRGDLTRGSRIVVRHVDGPPGGEWRQGTRMRVACETTAQEHNEKKAARLWHRNADAKVKAAMDAIERKFGK